MFCFAFLMEEERKNIAQCLRWTCEESHRITCKTNHHVKTQTNIAMELLISHILLADGSAGKQMCKVVVSPCGQIYRAHVWMYVEMHVLAY